MIRQNKRMYLPERNMNPNPFHQFRLWFTEAKKSGVASPDAFVLSTVNAHGQPSSRIVLLKELNEEGLLCVTNYASQKGVEIAANPRVSANFYWREQGRQIRIEGKAEKSDRAFSDGYFNSRSAGSRVSAIISPQSKVVPSRQYLEEQYTRFNNHRKALVRPHNWGGYLIRPCRFEFWEERVHRLHDRINYRLKHRNWIIERLAP